MSKSKAVAGTVKKTTGKVSLSNICDLCTGPFKPSEEVLQCDGSCQLLMHRYCAGISRHHYQELTDSSVPFMCLLCSRQLHKAEIQVLQSELASLKAELAELRALVSPAKASALPRKLFH